MQCYKKCSLKKIPKNKIYQDQTNKADNMTKNSKKNIGIIGCGYWGKNILRNLYEMGVLHTACDSNVDLLSEYKKVFPGAIFTTRLNDLLQTKDIKAIVISSPAITHYEIAKKVLLSDKDVFIEKPIALNTNHAQELIELAKNRKRILMVGHILHYHPAVMKLKEFIKKGELGKIQYIYSNRLNIGKLRTEENILWSFAPHDISAILLLVGEEPCQAKAFGEAILSKDIFDVTITTLEFASGIKGHIFVSWLHPYKEQKLIVVGSKAMAVFDDMTKEKLFIYPHKIEWQDGKIPMAQKAEHFPVKFEEKEPLRAEMEHFLECISARKIPRTDGKEALRVLRVLQDCQQSLEGFSSNKDNNPSRCKYFIHETSRVDEGAKIGKDTKIWHFCHILKNTSIGEKCIIGQNVMIGPDVNIGNNCKIQNNVSVYKGVTLENEVFVGPSAVFTNVYNPRAFIERKNEFRQTTVKQGASIGANATIVCGVEIGKYAFIGAGAVVKNDVPDHALVVGVPAKQIGWVCKCGLKLIFKDNNAKCSSCGNVYTLKNNKLTEEK